VSIEDLQNDYPVIVESLTELKQAIASDPVGGAQMLATWLEQNLVPFIGNQVTEMDEMDEAIQDLVEGTEAISPLTAGILGAPYAFGKPLIDLLLRLTPDAKVQQQCREWLKLHDLAVSKLQEITVEPSENDDDDDDDDDEGDGQGKGK
jgi:hypothetical protein